MGELLFTFFTKSFITRITLVNTDFFEYCHYEQETESNEQLDKVHICFECFCYLGKSLILCP